MNICLGFLAWIEFEAIPNKLIHIFCLGKVPLLFYIVVLFRNLFKIVQNVFRTHLDQHDVRLGNIEGFVKIFGLEILRENSTKKYNIRLPAMLVLFESQIADIAIFALIKQPLVNLSGQLKFSLLLHRHQVVLNLSPLLYLVSS